MVGRGGIQHGCKRRAADTEDDEGREFGIEQPITKRLARMSIDRPILRQASITSPTIRSGPEPRDHAINGICQADDRINDHMHLDDTANKIFIHSLDSEIAQIEAEEKATAVKTIFPADIDKKISAIPQRLLQNPAEAHGPSASETQMVLYQIPSSISVADGEQDHVRKAIMASRARVREEQVREGGMNSSEEARAERYGHDQPSLTTDMRSDAMEEEVEIDDPDAMDLG